jgi:opacity protein-like surface antigen
MFKMSRIALAACGCVVIATPAVLAADIVTPPPMPVPIPPAVTSAWYLRGDIGYSNQQVDELDNELIDGFDEYEQNELHFDSGAIFDVGIGFQYNKWLRADITGEYRSKVDFSGHDTGTFVDGDGFVRTGTNNYDAKKSEWLLLANAYADLGNYGGLTPYVGAGIGAARTTIHGFNETGLTTIPTSSLAYGDEESSWDLAWALYAGLGFDVTPAVTLDVNYRYLSIGDAASGDLIAFDGTNNIDNPMEFENITSHDVRLGFRYKFNAF